MSDVNKKADAILKALETIATVDALNAIGAKIDALDAKVTGLQDAHTATSSVVADNTPKLDAILEAVSDPATASAS